MKNHNRAFSRKRLVAGLLAFLIVSLEISAFAGIDGSNTMYLGGTVDGVKEKTEGKSSTADETNFVFSTKKVKIAIPYDQIDSIEYGQKAGRRLGVAVVVNPIFLLSKKRNHYLTIGWTDDAGKQQVAVFELGKSVVRIQLATLQARTGRKIEYQDEEARKYGAGN